MDGVDDPLFRSVHIRVVNVLHHGLSVSPNIRAERVFFDVRIAADDDTVRDFDPSRFHNLPRALIVATVENVYDQKKEDREPSGKLTWTGRQMKTQRHRGHRVSC